MNETVTETVPVNFGYLVAAYTLIWIFIVAYLGILMTKQRSLRRQIDEIRSRIASIPEK